MDFPRSVPSVGLVDGKFADEDPLAGTPGSLIPSAWGNAITLEVLSVIEAAGLEPNEEITDQLLQAIETLVTSASPGSATELQAGVAKIATSQDMADGTDDGKIATAKKIKVWFANVMNQATESAFGWAKVATQTQANSGADDFAFITSKKLSGTIAALIVQATETISGIAKLATQSQTNDGTDDATIVTPKKLVGGFSILIEENGYISFPLWLGSFKLQWGQESPGSPTVSIRSNFPIAFASNCYGIVTSTTTTGTNGQADSAYPVTSKNATGFNTFRQDYNTVNVGSDTGFTWLAWGK